VQLCIVHLVPGFAELRALESTQAGGGRSAVDLSAATAAEGEQHLQELEGKWKAYPSVSQVWRRNWTPSRHFSITRRTSPSDLHHQ